MHSDSPQPDLALRAGAAFLLAAGLLVAVHAGAQGRATGPEAPSTETAAGEPSRQDPPELREGAVEVRREVYVMGTRLEGRALATDRAAGLRALEAAFEAVEAEEDLLSTWRDDTALARLNAAGPGAAVAVPDRLGRLLATTWRIARASGGAFDPAVGALVEAWGLRGDGRRPAGDALAAARRASGTGCFELGDDGRVTPRCRGAWIDAGAFGKGSALGRARRALTEADATAALLDFGGQLLALGAPPGTDGWPAAVAHPARRDRPVARLRLRDRSAATTSASERFVTVDGEVRGHVLDPRTGRPAPAWGSATVVAEDPLRADALSTALFVMGPEAGLRWARGREDLGVLLLRPERGTDGVTACWNAAMERYLAEAPGPRRCRRAGGPHPRDGGRRSASAKQRTPTEGKGTGSG